MISNNPHAVVLNDHWIPMMIEDHWSSNSKNFKFEKDEVAKFLCRKISKSAKVKSPLCNHDYNPRLIGNDPCAVVLSDHWIPLMIEDHWSSNSKNLKLQNFYVEKFLSWIKLSLRWWL